MTIAERIKADLLAERPESDIALGCCFLCDRTFTAARGVGINGLFCSNLCLEAYDGGYVHQDPGVRYKYLIRGDGFLIACKGCKRPFVSKGLRCCSVDCERQLKERAEIAAVMAEVGAEPIDRPKRKCAECGKTIPMWRKGRKVSAATRFCSESCAGKTRRKEAKKAQMGCAGQTREIAVESAQKPLQRSVP